MENPDALRQFDTTAVLLRKAFTARMNRGAQDEEVDTLSIQHEALGELDLILAPARRNVAAGRFLG